MGENKRRHVITTYLNDDECEMLDFLLDEFDADEDQFLKSLIMVVYKLISEETE